NIGSPTPGAGQFVASSTTSGSLPVNERFLAWHRLPVKTYNRLNGEPILTFPMSITDSFMPSRSTPRSRDSRSPLKPEIMGQLTLGELAADAIREIESYAP